jgi:RNA polymerase sigma-70 factor (ECF subfamily)
VDDHGGSTEPALTRRPAADTDISQGQATHPSERVAAFSAFYREFVPTLVAFLVWQGARLPDAADIAQETMTRAYRDWEHIETPSGWARRVASREYARRIASIAEDPVSEMPDTNPLLRPGADVAAFEQRHEVLRLLALLPPRQRQVMAWTYDGYTPMEIAEELKIEPEAVRSSLRKARRTLARHLEGN